MRWALSWPSDTSRAWRPPTRPTTSRPSSSSPTAPVTTITWPLRETNLPLQQMNRDPVRPQATVWSLCSPLCQLSHPVSPSTGLPRGTSTDSISSGDNALNCATSPLTTPSTPGAPTRGTRLPARGLHLGGVPDQCQQAPADDPHRKPNGVGRHRPPSGSRPGRHHHVHRARIEAQSPTRKSRTDS